MKLLRDIRLFIGWVHVILQFSIGNGRIVKEHRLYLKGGKYKNSLKGDYIYEKSSSTYLKDNTYSSLSHFNAFIDSVLYRLVNLFTYSVKENNEKMFRGTEMILSSSRTEIKIFSSETNEVLTKYKNVDKLKRNEADKKYFGHFFNVPETISLCIEDGYIIERFIPHVKFEAIDAFHYFSDKIVNYLNEIKNTITYDKQGDERKIEKFSNYIGDSYMLQYVVGLPKLMVHGDFWNYNVIYDGNNYYLIDYEKKGIRFFLYDFFCFIFSEYTLLNDSRLLKSYLAGGFDSTLFKMFEAVGYSYDNNKRGEYFLAFLVEILNERTWSRELSNELVGGLLRIYLPSYYNSDEENYCNNRS